MALAEYPLVLPSVEGAARGVYCGAVGWMAPGGDADFSVAIRTLSLWQDRVVMNVGGGVVADSTATGEWEEALWKARFVTAATRSEVVSAVAGYAVIAWLLAWLRRRSLMVFVVYRVAFGLALLTWALN